MTAADRWVPTSTHLVTCQKTRNILVLHSVHGSCTCHPGECLAEWPHNTPQNFVMGIIESLLPASREWMVTKGYLERGAEGELQLTAAGNDYFIRMFQGSER